MKVYKTEKYIEKGKSIHIFKSEAEGELPIHTHDFIEMVYALEGQAIHTVDGVSYETRRGDLIFMHCGSIHAFTADGRFSYVNICFSPETLDDSVLTPVNAFSLLTLSAFNEMRCHANGGKLSFEGAERDEIEAILHAMLTERANKQSSWHTVMENYLNILITKMARKNEVRSLSADVDGIWRELLAYIDANLDTKLTLSALAQKCFYNPSYFSRIFKEKFRMSPVEYINRKRVEQAMQLLRDSGLSVDEIGQRVGFSDRSNFHHAFFKYVKLSPSDYRKQMKK